MDPILEKAIREEIEKPEGKLSEADFDKVTELFLNDNHLPDVKGLEKLTKLTGLRMLIFVESWSRSHSRTCELTKAALEKVRVLNLDGKQLHSTPRAWRLTDVKGLENLTQLTKLHLHSNQLTDVKGLENLTQLTWLRLGDNQLTDVKGLEKLTQLTMLQINDNQLTDVKGLEKLTKLTWLSLGDNQLTDVKGLEKFTQLTTLQLNNNQLTDVRGLEKLTQLTTLRLDGNPDLTKAQIDELQKALPNCRIDSDYD